MKHTERFLKFMLSEFGTNKDFEVLTKFPVLYSGWECDEEMWLIAVNDKKHVIGTNHGAYCIVYKDELREKINEYMTVLSATIDAISQIE